MINPLQTPLVSIIINNYNYGRFLSEAVNSALSQTYARTEVIVVDDGSTDNSREVILSYGDQITALFKENGGQASAINEGFKASKGEIICLLDADDIFQADKVEEIVNIFKVHSDISWCFHPLRYVDTNTNVAIQKCPEGLESSIIDFRSEIRKARIPFFPPATSGLCFTHLILDKILPMPESIVCISDNYIKYVALFLSPGYFLDEELAILRIHGNNVFTNRNDKQRLGAHMHMLIAFWMRSRFPVLAGLSNKMFSIALATYWRDGNVGSESQEVVKNYLSETSLLQKMEVYARAFYHSNSLLYSIREFRLSNVKERVKKGEVL